MGWALGWTLGCLEGCLEGCEEGWLLGAALYITRTLLLFASAKYNVPTVFTKMCRGELRVAAVGGSPSPFAEMAAAVAPVPAMVDMIRDTEVTIFRRCPLSSAT